MRRVDREVKNIKDKIEIINSCKVVRLAMKDKEGLYILPLNFGYSYLDDKLTLYFHSAKRGRKLEAIMENPEVAFEMDCAHRLIEAEIPCLYGFAYKSVIGNGVASIVEDMEEKKVALSLLMKHQAEKDFVFEDRHAKAVSVFKVDVTDFSAKEHQ
ncbi:pyridoxamine 5'-phosphate oxidase family protein [Clostridium sp.]|uniref:pyridoxamine 5'-phosphate oxidase family protein n=1 Tax=Clostridium sp. TaxID=1506 RepID=UPI0025BECB1D|nr:pyridoxamine 5'-phosphate oxidase family protein [Clostridium sp.]